MQKSIISIKIIICQLSTSAGLSLCRCSIQMSVFLSTVQMSVFLIILGLNSLNRIWFFFCWTWYDFIIISDCNIAVRSPPVCRDRRRISFLYRVRSSALRANTFSAQQLFYNRRRRRVGSGGGQTEPMTSCQATRLQKWECSECTEVRGFESWSKQLSSPVSASQHTHAPAAVAACVFFSFIFSHTITGRLD